MALLPFLKPLETNDPQFAEAIEKVANSAMGPGSLDQKTKILIALALDAAHGSIQGVTSLANRAREVGITNEEIAEALRIAYYAFGNSILTVSAVAFKE